MTIETNAFESYVAIGNREDLIDVITNISPVDTYFTNKTGSGRAKARTHEWQTDALAAAAANAQIEGNSTSVAALTPTTRVLNYTQILTKNYRITGTQEAVDHAGRESEKAYQKAKKMEELARDIEYALVINSSAVSGDSATARQLKGLQGWITTNVTTGSSTASETLTEAMLNDNLQLIWAQGGKPATVLCGAFQKRTISGFSTNTKNVDADEKKLVNSVDVYDSDFGRLSVRLHHQVNTTIPSVLFILGDMKLWKKAWLRPPKWSDLARGGDSFGEEVICELTLESLQEKGSGKITELATS